MNWRVLAVGLVVIVPLVALLAAGFGRDPKLRSESMVGRAAPVFNLEQLEGGRFSLKGQNGQPVVVNFWSTWCQPCKIEHPILLDAARIYQPMGVRFVSVLYQDDAAKARVYLRKNGSEWPTLVDPGGRTAISYGVAGVPETFFIDRNGVVVHKVAGPVGAEEMITTLQGML